MKHQRNHGTINQFHMNPDMLSEEENGTYKEEKDLWNKEKSFYLSMTFTCVMTPSSFLLSL